VALAEGIPMPCVMGLRRPRILIPSRLAEQLGAAGLRALLLHEDAHRQRHEPLREAVLEVIACLLFLLPLVRTACRRLRESSEFVCDEHVLRAGVAGPLYARALSASVQAAVWSPPLALASGAHRGSRLQRRFVRLLQPGRFVMKHPHRVAAAALAGLFVLGILVPAAWIGGCGGESSEQVGPGGPADNPAEEALTRPQTMPELLEMDPPVYPEAVRREGVQGIVVVRGLLRAEGHVDSISAVEGPEQLRESAIASLRTARFRPATQEGMPVDTWVQLPFQFSLD
jgi:TonB family protein